MGVGSCDSDPLPGPAPGASCAPYEPFGFGWTVLGGRMRHCKLTEATRPYIAGSRLDGTQSSEGLNRRVPPAYR